MRRLIPVFLISFLLIGMSVWTVQAQTDPTPTPPPAAESGTDEQSVPKVHVIGEGESLFYIAELYTTTVESLQLVNGIDDPSLIFVGQELVIPGAVGDAVPTAYTVQLGDTLATIAARYNTDMASIGADNHIVNPDSLLAGTRLVFLSRTGSVNANELTGRSHTVQAGENIYGIAMRYGVSAGQLAMNNGLDAYRPRVYVGQRIIVPSDDRLNLLPGDWRLIEVNGLPVAQGGTLVVYVENHLSGNALGQLIAPDGTIRELRFLPDTNRPGQTALIGFDAFAPDGRYELRLSGEGVARPWWPFSQSFVVSSGNYGLQNIILDESYAELLAPEVRRLEDEFLQTIFTSSSEERKWTTPFTYPVSGTFVTAGYGDARSYNGGPIEVFHSGIDFSGQIGTPITAPADGTVVFSGTLRLRGNSLIIDHGWGVMTAYYHLSEIESGLGETVTSGQLIGLGGNTGLSTGPHLHWDLRVWGVPVQPQGWVGQEIWP